jgi:hypothetical protein
VFITNTSDLDGIEGTLLTLVARVPQQDQADVQRSLASAAFLDDLIKALTDTSSVTVSHWFSPQYTACCIAHNACFLVGLDVLYYLFMHASSRRWWQLSEAPSPVTSELAVEEDLASIGADAPSTSEDDGGSTYDWEHCPERLGVRSSTACFLDLAMVPHG